MSVDSIPLPAFTRRSWHKTPWTNSTVLPLSKVILTARSTFSDFTKISSPLSWPQHSGRPAARGNALLFINAWCDTRQVRAADSKAYAVLNDEQPIPGAVIEAFRNYDIRPVAWTQRIDGVTELAA